MATDTSPRSLRPWARGILVLTALLSITPSIASSPTATARPAVTPKVPGAHLRLEVTSTSDWAAVTVGPMTFQASRILSDPTGVSKSNRSVRVDGARTAVVDAIVPLPAGTDLDVVVTKGTIGSVTVVVRQLDAAGRSTERARVVDTLAQDATNDVATTVSAASLLSQAVELGATDPQRLVIAAFYPWWTGSEASRIGPDRPTGTWTTATATSIRSHLTQMADAGINTAAVSMGWPQAERKAMTALTIKTARTQSRVRLVPYIELEVARTLLGWNEAWLEQIIGESVASAKANPTTFVFRSQRPVLFFYGDQQIPADVWNRVIGKVEARYGQVFAVTHSLEAGRRTDGVHSYLDGGSVGERWGQAYNRTVQGRYQPMLDPSLPERVVVSTVNPGLDDSCLGGLQPRVVPRDGTSYYQTSWDIAVGAQPDWVFVTSWNEWWEQTQIAPSTGAGSAALDVTRTRAMAFAGTR